MPALTLSRTTPDTALVLPERDTPLSNGHGTPPSTNGGGPGGGRPGGGGGDRGGSGGSDDVGRVGWRVLHWSLAAVALVALACLVANWIPVADYVVSAAKPRSVAPLLSSAHADLHQLDGRVLSTGVEVTKLSAFGYLFYATLSHVPIMSAAAVLGQDVPASEAAAEEGAQKGQAVAFAKEAAFRQLGYSVSARTTGVLVLAVLPGSPSWTHLRPGDVVKEVDGVATTDDCTLARALAARRSNPVVTLSVERPGATTDGATTGSSSLERVRLTGLAGFARLARNRTCRQAVAGYLGIDSDTEQTFSFPFALAVRTSALPVISSSLSIGLGIVDALRGGDLTGGRTVAAAAALHATGRVGSLEGVADDAAAAWIDGATTLLVAATQVKAARAVVPRSFRILGVRSLAQAVSDLRRLGSS